MVNTSVFETEESGFESLWVSYMKLRLVLIDNDGNVIASADYPLNVTDAFGDIMTEEAIRSAFNFKDVSIEHAPIEERHTRQS